MLDHGREDVDAPSSLTPAGPSAGGEPARALIRTVDLLTDRECAEVRRLVHELRPHWIQRHPWVPFHTLGAACYLDAAEGDAATYHRRAAQYNPLLRERFQWLYGRLAVVLAEHLGAPVVYPQKLALPGFHLFLSARIFEHPVAPIHRDLQHRLLEWESPEDLGLPMSFTLAVALPMAGGGLNVWDLRGCDLVDIPPHALEERVRASPKRYVPYRAGRLVLHCGDALHQIAPTASVQPGDERVTLQGHGVLHRGRWHLFW